MVLGAYSVVLKYIAEARKASEVTSMIINLNNLLKHAHGEVDLNVFNDELVPNIEIITLDDD